MQSFFQHLQQIDVAYNTFIGYKRDLECFLTFYQKAYSHQDTFAHLQPADIVHFRQTMLHEHKLAATTINRRLHALRRFCRFCHDNGWLQDNPATHVKSMRHSKRSQPKGLGIRETFALLQAADPRQKRLGARNHALIQLLLQTGLRVSEVSSLLVGDLVIYDRSGCVHVRDGKGHRQRTVPLNATVRRAMREYLHIRTGLQAQDYAFVNERGRGLSIRSIQHTVSQMVQRAGLKDRQVSVHTLRHTFALNYLRDNPGKLSELARLLGHDSVNTTTIYACSSEQDMAEDLERSRFNTEKDLVGRK